LKPLIPQLNLNMKSVLELSPSPRSVLVPHIHSTFYRARYLTESSQHSWDLNINFIRCYRLRVSTYLGWYLAPLPSTLSRVNLIYSASGSICCLCGISGSWHLTIDWSI
jgi:hypothetical protein